MDILIYLLVLALVVAGFAVRERENPHTHQESHGSAAIVVPLPIEMPFTIKPDVPFFGGVDSADMVVRRHQERLAAQHRVAMTTPTGFAGVLASWPEASSNS
jgi:hypothetical protein